MTKPSGQGGIFFSSFDELKHALLLYAGMDDIELTETVDALMPPFLDNLFISIEQAMKQSGRFDYAFTEDGPGSFRRTIVIVNRLTKKPGRFRRRRVVGYRLRLLSADTGFMPERRLAKLLLRQPAVSTDAGSRPHWLSAF